MDLVFFSFPIQDGQNEYETEEETVARDVFFISSIKIGLLFSLAMLSRSKRSPSRDMSFLQLLTNCLLWRTCFVPRRYPSPKGNYGEPEEKISSNCIFFCINLNNLTITTSTAHNSDRSTPQKGFDGELLAWTWGTIKV